MAHLGVRGTNKTMSREISDLLKRALVLSADERAALANSLLDSLESGNESVQEAWDEEVARRIGDLKKGQSCDRPLGTIASRTSGHAGQGVGPQAVLTQEARAAHRRLTLRLSFLG